MKLLEKNGTHCLNESTNHMLAHVLSGEGVLESADDAQLLVTLAFREPVKCMRVILETVDDARAPKTVKLFVNNANLDFNEAEDETPTQTFLLSSAATTTTKSPSLDSADPNVRAVAYSRGGADGTLQAELELHYVRYQKVTHLSLFVVDNVGDSETSVIRKLDVSSGEKTTVTVPFVATEAQFEKALTDAGAKTVFVDFTAGWCQPCQAIKPKFQELCEHTEDAVFIKVDVDANSAVAKKYSVTSMPTFIAFKNGAKVAQMSGANEAKLVEFVQTHK